MRPFGPFLCSRQPSTKVCSPPLSLLIIALRLRPAVATNLQREIPPEGMMIAGEFVPGGVLHNLCPPSHLIVDHRQRSKLDNPAR